MVLRKGPNLISCPQIVLAPHQKSNDVNVKVYFWILNSIPLSYMSALTLVHYFDYCNFVLSPEIEICASSNH